MNGFCTHAPDCVQTRLTAGAKKAGKPGKRPRGGVVTQRIANPLSPLIPLHFFAHSRPEVLCFPVGIRLFCTQILEG